MSVALCLSCNDICDSRCVVNQEDTRPPWPAESCRDYCGHHHLLFWVWASLFPVLQIQPMPRGAESLGSCGRVGFQAW